MFRKLLTILSLIGLLLSVGMWGVSYFQWGIIVNRYSLWAFNGALVMGSSQRDMREDLEGMSDYHGISFLHLGGRCYLFSSSYGVTTKLFFFPSRISNQETAGVFVPLWMPTVLFSLTFLACRPLHFHRRRRRKKLGLCLKCGYDLRASKDRCPECGEAFEK